MTYSDKVESIRKIVIVFFNKTGRWPTPLEVLDYAVLSHHVKRDTARAYVEEAVSRGRIKHANGAMEAT